ncbi:trypsin-like peptidase domain-containing protein [Anaerotignum sp.]
MYDFDDVNPKKNENESQEEELIEGSGGETRGEHFEKEESIEMEANVISVEEEKAEEKKSEEQTEQTAMQEESREESPRPSVREYHYEEKVKKSPRKRKGWTKFIAGCLIVSIAGGASIGAGYGAAEHYFQSRNSVQTTAVTDTEKTSFLTDGLSTVDIVKKVKPSVVSVSTTVTGTAKYFGKYTVPYETEGAGSGVIFYSDDSKVAIATNNHVIEGASSIYVTFEGDISVSAKVIGTKSESDLAVLSVSWDDLKAAGITSVTTATFGDSDSLEVGECVIAIGNAMGMGLSATDGIISMKEQTISVDGNNLTVLQTSAAINSGNSGGALVNSKGEVIGINTAKYNSSMAEGMGYAIPSNVITPIVEELLDTGTQPKPYIGITGTSITEENASLYKLPVGALIMEVTENGPAAKAGLQVGDVITQYDGKTVMDMDTLVEMVNDTEIGKTVDIHVVRNGQEGVDLKIKIGDKNM